MSSTNLSFRTPAPLLQLFRDRDIKGVDNPGVIAKRDVERWYSLLGESLKKVRIEPEEAVVMIYAAHWWLGTMTGLLLGSLPEHLLQNMGLDAFYRGAQESLAQKVDGWPLSVRAALWDSAERYEVIAHRKPGNTLGGALHQVGLHSYSLDPEDLLLVECVPAVESDELPRAYMHIKNRRSQK